MTDEDTRAGLALRDRLSAAEPPLSVRPSDLRAAAQARMRSRRWAMTGATAAVVAAVAVCGWSFGTAIGGGQAPAAGNPEPFSPEALVASLQLSVSGAQAQGAGKSDVSWQLEDVRAQVGPTSKQLSGADRARADRWQARFADGASHLVDVILIYEGKATVDSLQGDCSAGLAAKHDDLCEATTTSTGIPAQYIERSAYPMDESWPTPNDPLLPEPVPMADRWYLHQIKVFNPDGLTVVATEVVHTASSATAADQWTMSRGQLTQIATDPALTFPRQPETGN